MPVQPENYNTAYFKTTDVDKAKDVILNGNSKYNANERWINETKFLEQVITQVLDPTGVVLDYGCGIGRISKCFIDKRYEVIGVEPSPEFRELATKYVDSPRFTVLDHNAAINMANKNVKVDMAVAIWTLQHCNNVVEDINLIKQLLKTGGKFLVLNLKNRCLPVVRGNEATWMDDGINIWTLLEKDFQARHRIKYPEYLGYKSEDIYCILYEAK